MKLKNTRLRDAITFALFASVGMFSANAFAQDESAEDTAEVLDEVVTTGTRIQSKSVTASSPVAEIQQEEFKFAGATRPEDLINQYPQLSPTFDSFNNNGAQGYATVDLRGLGPQRTLTLVNGLRLGPGSGEVRDISIIPSALVSRVDILTGGASAVYGSDAVAGVVNFVLDTEFEGVSIGGGYSAYQHDNDNEYMQRLQTARNFPFEKGGSGFDGISRNAEIAVGSQFADGSGHAMAWLTWRENDALFQGQRDYSSCALNDPGTACGGSATNATGNFYFYQPDSGVGVGASLNANGTYRRGYGQPYNFAPINYFQRPDERFTFGSSLKYQINEHFEPYLETMFINRNDSIQIAESGVFFFGTALTGLSCNTPFLRTACADLGLNPALSVNVYPGRRNIEGGPRITKVEDSTYRFVFGTRGAINENWSYDASFLRARTDNDTQNFNDFLKDRIVSALLGCPAGSFAGCIPYNVWQPNGVTAEAANAMAGIGLSKTSTELTSFNAYVTGDLGFGFASAGDENISLVAGVEARRESFAFVADSNSAANNFAGTGAPSPPIDGESKVKELFLESAVPVYAGDGFLKNLSLDLGYRLSDYEASGNANTFKVGFFANADVVSFRGGFNRAIRAPGINNLFAQQQIALFTGQDPCAGATPTFTAAQCANTGVTAAQYGRIPANPASQNNQFIGGNQNLNPEEADTWTLGFVVKPLDNLSFTVDYYRVDIEDTIGTIGAATILEFCARTGDPFLCSRIQRNTVGGDLWRSDAAFVRNLTDNFGETSVRGIDLGANYNFDALGGNFSANFQGTYTLEYETAPLPGINDAATYDCAGIINPSCQLQDWRHIASLRYARDRYSVGLRWRYFGALDYVSNTGAALTADTLLAARGGIGSYSYLDLSGTASLTDYIELTLGVNNIVDKEPPLVGAVSAPSNANAPGGYDPAGRYIFSSINIKF